MGDLYYFSIIIPIYYKYGNLNFKSLESALNQDYKNYQIVLVGTKEDFKILDKKILKNKKIKSVLAEENNVSKKRNLGILNSNSTYVTFLDADDQISNDYLSSANKKNNNFDFLMFKLTRNIDDFSLKSSKKAEIVIKGENEINNIIFDKYSSSLKRHNDISFGSISAKFFKRNIIIKKKIYFDTKLSVGEDTLFCYSYLTNTSSILVSFEKKYYYRNNSSSSSNNLELKINDLSYFYQCFYSICSHNKYVECDLLPKNCYEQILKFCLEISKITNYHMRKKLILLLKDKSKFYYYLVKQINYCNVNLANKIKLFFVKKRMLSIIVILYKIKRYK